MIVESLLHGEVLRIGFTRMMPLGTNIRAVEQQ